MKKIVLILFLLSVNHIALAQVSINTTEPKTTLDIIAKNSTGTTTKEDVLLTPKADRERMQSMIDETAIAGNILYWDNSTTGNTIETALNVTQVGYYYNITQWDIMVTRGVPAEDETGQILAK